MSKENPVFSRFINLYTVRYILDFLINLTHIHMRLLWLIIILFKRISNADQMNSSTGNITCLILQFLNPDFHASTLIAIKLNCAYIKDSQIAKRAHQFFPCISEVTNCLSHYIHLLLKSNFILETRQKAHSSSTFKSNEKSNCLKIFQYVQE